MARIYLALAVFATLLIGATLVLGLRIGDYNQLYQRIIQAEQEWKAQQANSAVNSHDLPDDVADLIAQTAPYRRRTTFHMLFAIFACLTVLLVNSVSITYFIGTNRWCKEVSQTYHLHASHLETSTKLKRSTFPWSMAGVAAVLITAALGAASDPGRGTTDTVAFVPWHFWTAMVSVAIVAWAFLAQAVNIQRNSQLIATMMEEVQTIRQQKGLPTEAGQGGAGAVA